MKKSEIKKIASKKSITHCYIIKGSQGYYRPDAVGYTDHIVLAGVYPKSLAISHAEHCEELQLIPIDIKEHNNRIVLMVQELLTRIIK